MARQRLRQGRRRVTTAFVPILQAGLAATIAFGISRYLLGHQGPFLAAIGAWICLGFTRNRVPRKVAELGAGATVGVLLGELVAGVAGGGPLQVGIVLVAAALVGRLLDRGDMFTLQAGVNGMVVVGMSGLPMPGVGPFDRLGDAFVGALVAFVFSVLLPRDVTRRPRRFVRAVLDELAPTLEALAVGLRDGNPEALRDTYSQLSGLWTILSDAEDVVRSASDVARLNPTLWAERPELREMVRMLALLQRMLSGVEMLLRQSRGIVDESGAAPGVAELVVDAAEVIHALSGAVSGWHRPHLARERATELAARCTPRTHVARDWRPAVLVSLMRSVTIDLLQLTGMSRAEARQVLPDTGADEPSAHDMAQDTDRASEVW